VAADVLIVTAAAVQNSPPRVSSFFRSPSFVLQEARHRVHESGDWLFEESVIGGRGAGEIVWDSFRQPPPYPAAAPLPPAPRRFAIGLPRPRGIGGGGGNDRVFGSHYSPASTDHVVKPATGQVQRLVRPSASRGVLGDAEYRGCGRKPRTWKPMLDDETLPDRRPSLDSIVIESHHGRTVFDHHRAA
jgi:hypothetical protein